MTTLDVRPGDEFGAGRLSEALNITIRQLNKRRKERPDGKELIAYYRGP